jgi:hypothetical protein
LLERREKIEKLKKEKGELKAQVSFEILPSNTLKEKKEKKDKKEKKEKEKDKKKRATISGDSLPSSSPEISIPSIIPSLRFLILVQPISLLPAMASPIGSPSTVQNGEFIPPMMPSNFSKFLNDYK